MLLTAERKTELSQKETGIYQKAGLKMHYDFHNKEEIKQIPVAGCDFTLIDYDYRNREVYLQFNSASRGEIVCLNLHNVLYYTLRNTEIGSGKKIAGISIQEDCLPLKLLREVKEAKYKKEPSYLNQNILFVSIVIQMVSGGQVLIICETVDVEIQNSQTDSEIDKLLDMLDSRKDPKIQKEGIELAKKVKHLSVFIRPTEGKYLWENCAKILSQRTDKELGRYLEDLFEWEKDTRWPGAKIIFDRLFSIPSSDLAAAYSQSLKKAVAMKAVSWTSSLQYFAEKKDGLIDLLPEEQKKFLVEWQWHW